MALPNENITQIPVSPKPAAIPSLWNTRYEEIDANFAYLEAEKAPLASPALTGTPTAPTQAAGNNSTRIATTAFVQAAITALINSSPAALDTLNELAAALGNDANFATTMTNALALKAPLASPALTGTPTAPTPADGDNDTSIATTAFVQAATGGRLSKSVAGGANVTLTAAEAGKGILEFTGVLTANINVIVPTAPTKYWIVKNGTSGAFTLTVKTAAGTGVAVTQGKVGFLYTDGTNVLDAFTDFDSIALTGTPTAPTAAAGTNTTQLATTAFVQGAANAPGVVAFFAASTAQTGWLKANGAAVSRTTYANLFAAIGTTFGAGDGATTFNLPDLRGEFLRGWDDARGVDTGRAFGSAQADDNKAHTHAQQSNTAIGQAGAYLLASAGGSSWAYGGTTQSSGGTEARPRNIALLACIKY